LQYSKYSAKQTCPKGSEIFCLAGRKTTRPFGAPGDLE
jgi:hypothetical protein